MKALKKWDLSSVDSACCIASSRNAGNWYSPLYGLKGSQNFLSLFILSLSFPQSFQRCLYLLFVIFNLVPAFHFATLEEHRGRLWFLQYCTLQPTLHHGLLGSPSPSVRHWSSKLSQSCWCHKLVVIYVIEHYRCRSNRLWKLSINKKRIYLIDDIPQHFILKTLIYTLLEILFSISARSPMTMKF